MFLGKKKVREYTAAILIVGNEILSGRTQDLNISFLARELSKLGISLLEVRVVPDKIRTIVRCINEFRKKHKYVFTTGGLGPTHDDVTTSSVARLFKVPLYRDQEAVAMIKTYYHETNKTLDESAFKMADIPTGATLILNDVSGAPGFKLKNVFVLAGIPKVMQAMFNYAKIYLKASDKFVSKSVQVEVGESVISLLFGKLQRKYADLDLGSYPVSHRGKWCTHLVIRGRLSNRVTQANKELGKRLLKEKIEFAEVEEA